MSDWHLGDLRSQLRQATWRIDAELPGNDYDISASWRIVRPNGSQPIHIDFDGLDDMQALPIEQAYGCRAREAPELTLYFRRKGDLWTTDVQAFIAGLANVPT